MSNSMASARYGSARLARVMRLTIGTSALTSADCPAANM